MNASTKPAVLLPIETRAERSTGLGFFLPTLWLPSFVRALDMPSFVGPLGLALYNLFVCIGAVIHGALVDRYHATTAMLVSTVGQMVAIFVFWGLTNNQAMVYVFAMIYGVFAGGKRILVNLLPFTQ